MAIFNNETIKKFQSFFGVGFNKTDSNKVSDKLFAVKQTIDPKTKAQTLEKLPFDDDLKALLQYWLTDCHQVTEDWKNRSLLFQDMDMLYYNCAMIARAIELISDEVIQADSNEQPILVEAKRALKKDIMEFFDSVNIYSLIRQTIVDIIHYGNSGWLLSFNENGVEEIIPTEVYDIKDRLEFTPYEVEEKINGHDKFFTQFKSIDRVNQLITSLSSKDEGASRFKSYLFGFQISDYVVPPWRFLHFRNKTNKSPFKPFGIPMFIHSLAPFRQYDSAMTLQVLARGAKFPKNIYKLTLPNVIDPVEKLNSAIDFMRELQNAGIGSSRKEEFGVGETIVTIEGLYSYEQESPDVNLDKIDDITALRDDLIISTQLPRNLIDPNDSGFGDSGVSLIEKWKPFARLVYRVQNSFLEQVSQLVKLHFIQNQKYALEDIDFVLSMPFPESQIDNDIITTQSSLMDLANNVIASIEDKVLNGNKLPPEIIKTIWTKFLPYDDVTIETWIDEALKALPEIEKEKEESGDEFGDEDMDQSSSPKKKFDPSSFYGETVQQKEKIRAIRRIESSIKSMSRNYFTEASKSRKLWDEVEKRFGKQNLKEMVSDIIFEKKQEALREGVIKSRHYYSSVNKNLDFPAEKLRELDVNRLQKLKEKEDIKEFNKEEVKYVFTFDGDDEKPKKKRGRKKNGNK